MGEGRGKVTMPGLHGCTECCEGCQLRRCCCRPSCRLDNPWRDLHPHLCNHCDTLYDDGEMTLEQVRFEVVRLLRAHAAMLVHTARASRCAPALVEQKKRRE